MPVTEINHYNLRAPRDIMHVLKDFYCDVIGLKVGPRDGFTSYGFWLYIGNNDVLHIAEYKGEGAPLVNVLTTFDHVAFTCTDFPAMETHLKEHQVPYSIRMVPAINVQQINLKDPVGNGIELNFYLV